MVIRGNGQRQIPEDAFKFVEFEGERIRLPDRFADVARLSGPNPLSRVLLVIKPGAFRLIDPPEESSQQQDFDSMLTKWDEAAAAAGPLEKIDSDKWAAIRASLIPCVLSPKGPGWRVQIPKVARMLAPPGDHSGVFLAIVAGYVELWFPDVMRQALSGSVLGRFE
jgi:hypothetical protein